MRCALLLSLALAACSDGSESDRPQHQLIAAARQGIYAVKAAPGGALALFSDVRLVGRNTVCGVVDGQDGDGLRHFAAVAGNEPIIEQPRDPQLRARIDEACKGPSRTVVSRNASYTDISVDEQAR